MLAKKHVSFDQSNVLSINNMLWSNFYNIMHPTWSLRDDNKTSSSTGHGDNSICCDPIRIDGDLMFCVGWGDGFAVKRINDDGTITQIFSDISPLSPEVTTYQYFVSVAIDKVRKKCYVSTFNYNGVAVYDYSNPASIVKDGVLTTSNSNIPSCRAGREYKNGLYVIGDYLYIVDNYAYHSVVERWNTQTDTSDNISVINFRNTGAGGSILYDEVNNRLFISNFYNGELWVVINPENATTDPTNPAKAYCIRISEIFGSDDMYNNGVVVDSINPNHIWVSGYYRYPQKIDISGILNETATVPTPVNSYIKSTINMNSNSSRSMCANYLFLNNHAYFNDSLFVVTPDRGYAQHFGFFDYDNYNYVAAPKYCSVDYKDDGNTEYVYQDGDVLKYDYGFMPILVESSGGYKYWVGGGYGVDGSVLRTWSHATYPEGMCFKENGDITFGTFQLDVSENIGSVQLHHLSDSVFEMIGSTFLCQVSNDNGLTWETYDYVTEPIHSFSSTGNQLKVKFTFTGAKNKCAYIYGKYPISVSFFQKDILERQNFIKHARLRIKGM